MGAGGFLSGFRYLIRNLVNHFREMDKNISFPFLSFSTEEAVKHLVQRVQVASDILIMQVSVLIFIFSCFLGHMRRALKKCSDMTFHLIDDVH
jgi:hypothetical protein